MEIRTDNRRRWIGGEHHGIRVMTIQGTLHKKLSVSFARCSGQVKIWLSTKVYQATV